MGGVYGRTLSNKSATISLARGPPGRNHERSTKPTAKGELSRSGTRVKVEEQGGYAILKKNTCQLPAQVIRNRRKLNTF